MRITLTEAASLLGVTKETLRNWDRSGKLSSIRDPKNNYRLYQLSEVQALAAPLVREPQADYALVAEEEKASSSGVRDDDSLERDFKRALSKVHKILRDTDGSSSIVERFDETTKLIFLKLLCEQSRLHRNAFEQVNESDAIHALRLRTLFESEASANSALFPDRFAKLRLSDAALSAAGSVLAKVELSSSKQDVKGFAYEEMIRNTFDKGDHQQFFTPQPVVEFLVALMGGMLAGRICDPASGTGGFLVEIAKRGIPTEKLLGLEIDDRLAWVAGINLFVHGAAKFETRCLSNGGSLGSGGVKLLNSMDAIITNPPFGSDFSDRSDLERYVLGKGRTSRRRGVLFIERCLGMLKEGGLLGIVIDEGVLSLSSNADVRELILAQADLLAVISLPETAFMPYASVSTSILLLRKSSSAPTKQLTFYARVESVGRKPNGDPDVEYDEQGLPRLISDLPDVLSAWDLFERNGTLERQTDNIYLANPLALTRSDASDGNRIDFKFHHPARLSAQIGLKDCKFDLVSLGEICSVRNESYVPSVDFPDQVIPYTGLAHIESRVGHAHQVSVSGNSLKSAVKRYYKGDILFAKMRPNLRKVALVDFDKPGYASAECVVLTVNERRDRKPVIDPFLLSILLRSDYSFGQIIHLIAGIGRPRIGLKDLLAVKIPLPSATQQKAFRETFLKTRETYESLRVESRRLSEAAAAMELQAIESVAGAFIGRH